MLSLRSLLLALLFWFLCLDLVTAERYQIRRRADSSSPPITAKVPSLSSTSSSSISPSPTEGSSKSQASGSFQSAVATNSSTSATTTTSSPSALTTSSISPSAVPSSINEFNSSCPAIFNATLCPDELPISPQITPGFSVAGVLLIVTGSVYALVGMRNKWIHIFLSAAYLASLAVTVLIVYVMNPPVSNGIQGAYVVAITLTGCILGGAALLLMEMTEGLGCLFGGFCISMWFLVLKPGGLLTSTGPVVIFIVCFTIAGWATSFSRYTRPYGLIVLMSFGGATVLILGIDCFSRAGLKEFWAYIWNLNQNLFPLGATTYPLTRGMKVEMAAIVIIFIIGMASQTKLWRIIRKHRERRALDRQDDQRYLSREEEKVGRRIENATARQRAYWEAVYGKNESAPSADSGIGSIRNQDESRDSGITSTRHSGEEDIEMRNIPVSNRVSIPFGMTRAAPGMEPKRQPSFVVKVVDDEGQTFEAQREGENGLDTNRLSHKSSRNSRNSRRDSIDKPVDEEAGLGPSGQNSKRTSKRTSGGPEVVPLPFTVPEDGGDDTSSVATFADDDRTHRLSKRFSQGSDLLRSLSQRSHLRRNRVSKPLSVSTEQLVESADAKDDRSSLAATVDDLSDDEDSRKFLRESPERSPVDSDKLEKSLVEGGNDEREIQKPTPDEGVWIKSALNPDPSQMSAEAIPVPALFNAPEEALDIKEESEEPGSRVLPVAAAVEQPPVALTKDALPPAMPKVASSYRTNEWAKHLSSADAPEVEELEQVQDGTQVDIKVHEAPASINKKLQQMPESALIAPALTSTSQPSSHPSPQQPRRTDSYQSLQSTNIQPSPTPYTHATVPRSASQQSLQRSLSQQMQNMRSYRNSSTPNIGQTLVESPVEDMPQAFPPSNTLLDQRDAILRNKSALGFNSSLPTSVAVSPFASSTRLSMSHDVQSDDPLAARRSVIRQSSMTATPIPLPQNAIYDSHQPRRQSSTPVNSAVKDAQLAQWRASMQQDLATKTQPKKSLDRSRSALLQERMLVERQKEMELTMKGMQDKVFDERMRKGDMLDAHREAIKKMQKEANKNLQ